MDPTQALYHINCINAYELRTPQHRDSLHKDTAENLENGPGLQNYLICMMACGNMPPVPELLLLTALHIIHQGSYFQNA